MSARSSGASWECELAQAVLRGEFREGETVVVDNEGGPIVFRHKAREDQPVEAASTGGRAAAAGRGPHVWGA
ncbi:MAG TPA: hypothetical protein VKF37_13660 [Chloroflexota bacterium]|nr:hypothetical protein [Chloroflexota bacterium]